MASAGVGDGAVPAWKLRLMQQQQQRGAGPTMPSASNLASTPASSLSSSLDQAIPKGSNASSCSSTNAAEARAKLRKKMEAATLDPNLPPAFKVVMKGRLAFARQQERRKNNDTWVSLNSSHVNAESTRPADYADPDSDDDSSYESMGEESYEEESYDHDDAVIEEGDEDDEED